MTRKTQLKQTRSHFGLGYESIWAQASLAYETFKVTGHLLYTMSKYFIVEITRTGPQGIASLDVTDWKLRNPRVTRPKLITVGTHPECHVQLDFNDAPVTEKLAELWLAPTPPADGRATDMTRDPAGEVALYAKNLSPLIKMTVKTTDDAQGQLLVGETHCYSTNVQFRFSRLQDGLEGKTYAVHISCASASALGLSSDIQQQRALIVRTVETLRAFCKHTHIQCLPTGVDSTTLATLAEDHSYRGDPWAKYLQALLRMRVTADFAPASAKVSAHAVTPTPTWLSKTGNFGMLWGSYWFRCLFWDKLDAHLCLEEAPELVPVPLKNERGETRQQLFYKFRIIGPSSVMERPDSSWCSKKFSGGIVEVNQNKPCGFTHGLHPSHVLSVLINGARLTRSKRTKCSLEGAWVGQADDYETCDYYAGPERPVGANGAWIQAFLIGQTWDLKNPRHKTYRCIRTREGHCCTHALFRIWPNDENENKALRHYHFRPPGGLPEFATDTFKEEFYKHIQSGCNEGATPSKRCRVGT